MSKLFYSDYVYEDDIDILVRVYEDQTGVSDSIEDFCGEVLFKPHLGRDHIRITGSFPKGVALGLAKEVKKLQGLDVKVQVSNELTDSVGFLTSCRAHFINNFKSEILNT